MGSVYRGVNAKPLFGKQSAGIKGGMTDGLPGRAAGFWGTEEAE